MDFTLKIYKKLLESLLKAEYTFITFEEYCGKTAGLKDQSKGDGLPEKFVVMRHDVDEYAWNAFEMAKVECFLGIKATYFFRKVKQSNVPEVIKQIVTMGHEIGYHYETLSVHNGNIEKAIDEFKQNLIYFRTYYPVKTVCMHGSSTSQYDNRDLWKSCNLTDFELIGEPYLSVDFGKIFYITDTGYAWDGRKYAVRDVVENRLELSFHVTKEIIESIKNDTFPNQSMILAHTLWTSKPLLWLYLFVRENIRIRVKLLSKSNKYIARIYAMITKFYWKNK